VTTLKTLEDKMLSLRATRDYVANEIAALHKEMKQYQPQQPNMGKILFPIVRDFNAIIGQNVEVADIMAVFFGIDHTPTINQSQIPFGYPNGTDIWSILVDSGAFESKGQARKNWQGIKEIPDGYSELGPIGKSKLMLFLWNPSE